MNKKNINGQNVQIITESRELAALCAAWNEKDYLAIDTEFLRSSSYWPKLCLIQIGYEGEGVLIDPLANNMDLAPFFALMTNPDIIKVVHAGRQDIEIFYHLGRCLPAPLFDTQIAAMACGFGDAASYEMLVKNLLSCAIDKSSRVTDWSRRPLSERQMLYALSDVTYLCDVYKTLGRRLDKENRRDWVAPEFAAMSKPAPYINEPAQAWRSLKFNIKTEKHQTRIMAIAAWRESEAQRLDKPRGWIMRDDLIRDLALAAANGMALEDVRGIHKNLLRSRSGEGLRAALADADKYKDKIEKPKKGRRNNGDASLSMLKLLLKIQCERSNVAPKLVASAQQVEDFASNMHTQSPLLDGWRYELFGQYAQAMLQGELSLTLHQGKPEIIKTKQKEIKPRAQAES